MFEGNLQYIGRLPIFSKYKSHTEPQIVKIFKDRYNLQWSGYKRTNLKLKQIVSGLKKFDVEQPTGFCPHAWDLSYEWMEKHFKPAMGNSKLATWDEVLAELNMQSSSGYPYKNHFPKKKDVPKQVYDDIIDLWEVFHKKENNHAFIFLASLKDENRALDKLDQPRVFEAAPLCHNMFGLKLWLHMNKKLFKSETDSFVGKPIQYGHWHNLAERINKFPDHVFSFDMKRFDTTLAARLLWDQYKFRVSCLVDISEEDKVRALKWYDALINAYIVFAAEIDKDDFSSHAVLFRKFSGNPSGVFTTITDNTCILWRANAYSFIRSCHEAGVVPSYHYYQANTEKAMVGDDNLTGASDEILPLHNPTNIIKYTAELGMTATSATGLRTDTTLKDIDFLSMKFKRFKGYYVPEPEYDKVMCSLECRSSDEDVRWILYRAFALRVQSYFNKKCRDTLSQFIHWAMDEYSEQLKGAHRDVEWVNMYKSYKTDTEIERMYIGWESNTVEKQYAQSKRYSQNFAREGMSSLDLYRKRALCNTDSIRLEHSFDREQTLRWLDRDSRMRFQYELDIMNEDLKYNGCIVYDDDNYVFPFDNLNSTEIVNNFAQYDFCFHKLNHFVAVSVLSRSHAYHMLLNFQHMSIMRRCMFTLIHVESGEQHDLSFYSHSPQYQELKRFN